MTGDKTEGLLPFKKSFQAQNKEQDGVNTRHNNNQTKFLNARRRTRRWGRTITNNKKQQST